eukprot:CAMPEP_0182854316 /NCGR_PEP_ID=MMETSP0034_2-20130328/1183_1 /TAXON_ID=156128 /ORGANISM="Nephroselmis pyriformis, Strain CCMP717" /LENGTH=243 /DNA_ID=CAMNT_0024985135 /DNA_START=176 /DNA_END=906 /DNA_ORIENTATION=+
MSDLNSFLSSATSLSARSSPPLKTHASAARNLWAARSLLFSSASPRRSEAASARDSEAAARARRNSAASSPPAGAPGSQPVPSPPPACPEPARKPLSRRAPVSSSTIELLNDRSGRPSRGAAVWPDRRRLAIPGPPMHAAGLPLPLRQPRAVEHASLKLSPRSAYGAASAVVALPWRAGSCAEARVGNGGARRGDLLGQGAGVSPEQRGGRLGHHLCCGCAPLPPQNAAEGPKRPAGGRCALP